MRLGRKKLPGWLKWVLVVILVIYIGSCIYLSWQLYGVMKSAFECYEAVENNPYSEIIADEDYNRLVRRRHYDFESAEAWDEYKILGPLAVHWLVGGKAVAWYDYDYYVGSEHKSGSSGVPVVFSLRLEDFRWRIVDIFEAP